MSRVPATPRPPEDLRYRPLPMARWPAGTRVIRIHPREEPAIRFAGGARHRPRGRWDSPTGAFAGLQAAPDFAGAFIEAVLHDRTPPVLGLAEIAARMVSVLALDIPVQLVDMGAPGFAPLGPDDDGACGAWADALHAHPQRPAGILYPSRRDPRLRCCLLFDRLAPRLSTLGTPVGLADLPAAVGAELDRHGVALDAG